MLFFRRRCDLRRFLLCRRGRGRGGSWCAVAMLTVNVALAAVAPASAAIAPAPASLTALAFLRRRGGTTLRDRRLRCIGRTRFLRRPLLARRALPLCLALVASAFAVAARL